ncbi:hypothetical protein RCH33_1265 [Flavobacterium daejeonense]|nr:hypothetical protein RCH33_1265 [Flavobacterium daejeonense]
MPFKTLISYSKSKQTRRFSKFLYNSERSFFRLQKINFLLD